MEMGLLYEEIEQQAEQVRAEKTIGSARSGTDEADQLNKDS